MKRKINFLMIITVLFFATACKKEDASSKIDATKTEITPADPNAVNPDGTVALPKAETEKLAPPADGKYPVMTFEETEYDFGDIKQGDKVEHTFKFKNTGEADLLISSARASCGCTVPEYPKTAIKPGKTGDIRVKFNSEGKKGVVSKNVTITCNTENGAEIIIIKTNIKVSE